MILFFFFFRNVVVSIITFFLKTFRFNAILVVLEMQLVTQNSVEQFVCCRQQAEGQLLK